jgi:hypothetical protein
MALTVMVFVMKPSSPRQLMKSLPSKGKMTLILLRKGLTTFNSKKGQVVV